MIDPEPTFTSRAEMESLQIERLPSLARQWMLHLHPKRAMESAAAQDALELSAADVVESGREFAELNDAEKANILARNYRHCLQRNTRFMRALEERN